MDNVVPPHFHKDYRIDERDLIPNGSYISVVPDYPAAEGTRVNYLNGSDYRQYIMIDGTWRAISGGESDLFSSYNDLVHWNSVDGFATTIGTGGNLQPQDGTLYLSVSGSAGATTQTGLHSKDSYKLLYENGKPVTVEFQISFLDGVDLGLTVYLLLTAEQAIPPTETYGHVGFKIVGVSPPVTNTYPAEIHATSSGGTTQVLTNTGATIAASTFTRFRLRLVFTPGADCKFYVNGMLAATHAAADLPVGIGAGLNMSIWSRTSAQDRTVILNRVLINKQY